MSRVLYGFVYLISLIPLWVLYFFSDFLSFCLNRVFGYRKGVIYSNIRRCFPEYSDSEVKRTANGFYHYFTDLFVEVLKNFSEPRPKAHKRLTLKGTDVLDKAFEQNDIVYLAMGHYGNWETLLSIMNAKIEARVHVLFKPFKSEALQWVFDRERFRHGTNTIHFKKAVKEIKEMSGKNLVVFITDQTPLPQNAIWLPFFGQTTAVFKGVEKMAQKYNVPVLFADVEVLKRGHYQVTYLPVSFDPKSTEETEISRIHTQLVEQNIRRNPKYWLWSHKRWKHTPPSESGS